MKVPKAKKKPSGKWYIQLRLGGESIYVDDYSEKGCTQKAQLIKAEYLAGKRVAEKNGILLKDAIRNYIESRRSRLSPATIQGYEKILNNNFQSIMEVPLNKLTWRMCDDAIAAECAKTSRRGKPYSAKTVTNAWMLIASVLKINRISFDLPLELKVRTPCRETEPQREKQCGYPQISQKSPQNEYLPGRPLFFLKLYHIVAQNAGGSAGQLCLASTQPGC